MYDYYRMKAILTEIIRKECERYRLIEFGLLSSVEEGVEKLLPLILTRFDGDFNAFSLWRKQVLDCFYAQLEYPSFLSRIKKDPTFYRFVYYMQKRLLNTIRKKSEKVELDKNLALSGRTIAFKTSKGLVEDTAFLWEAMLCNSVSPEELEFSCQKFCKKYFPLDFEKLLNRLKKNDLDFWTELFLLIKRLVVDVTSKNVSTISYKEEIEQDTWEKTSFFLQKKLSEGTLPELKSSAHFRHYILKVCINKCHESYRDSVDGKLVFTSDGNMFFENSFIEEDGGDWFDSLEDVDVNNDSEISRALAYILWERLEPYYSRLVSGLEVKVTIFLLHYMEDKSYEEIVRMYHPDLPVSLSNKWQGKYRQDMVRVKKLLKKRLIEILSE